VRKTLAASSSFATAATMSLRRAREIASANIRSSSPSTWRRSSTADESTPVTARTSSCGLSRDPRRRRLGHTPSWRAATTTVSNSRPTVLDGVVTSTASSLGCGESVSSGTSASSTASRKTVAAVPGRRSTKRFAAVNRATMPSRLRFASAAVMPAPSAWSRQLRASPLRSQPIQSSSSMEPSLAASIPRVSPSFSATRPTR
jgi:hypothetical protein